MKCVLSTALLLFALTACSGSDPQNITPESPNAQASDDDSDDINAHPPATAPVVPTPEPVDPSPAKPEPDAALARYDGYGDLRFGMTADEAKKAWQGELKAVPNDAETCHFLSPVWAKGTADFALMVENGKFVRYDVGTNKELAPGGGGNGMTADQIRTLYAGRVEEQPHKYLPGGKYLRIKDASGSPGVLVFEADAAGLIISWRVGVAPQVDYVEGCS